MEADRISLIGADKAGRPCLVVTAANLIVADRSVDDCTRCICYALDCACEQVCGGAHQLRVWFKTRPCGPPIRPLHVPCTQHRVNIDQSSAICVTGTVVTKLVTRAHQAGHDINALCMLTSRWTRG